MDDNLWHHIAVSIPSNADLNQSMLYVDGKLVDAPNLSSSRLVNTVLSGSVNIGSNYNGSSDTNGSFDEVRISSIYRGSSWFKNSYENQKQNSTFLSTKLDYLSVPNFDTDSNISAMKDDNLVFQVHTNPPATNYQLISAPISISINSATGEITGIPDWVGDQTFTVQASNAKGSASTTLTIHSMNTKTIPIISHGIVSNIGGRSALLKGQLVDAGAASCNVHLYYGLTDENEDKSSWSFSKNLGSLNEGPVSYELLGLNSGETYYYRFEANNTEFSSWSDAGSFKTLRFDQGVLRFHTGINEDGDQSGLFWDKNGSGEVKIQDANITTDSYIAPDGSAWMLSKAIFNFDTDFYLGENLEGIVLEGINALSIQSEGNVSIGKSLSGSPIFAPNSAHVLNGTVLDGHDVHYGDDPLKGMRLGKGQLGGFSGAQGPGKGLSLGNSGAGGLSGGGGSFAGEGGPGASGPAGIRYGSGSLDVLIGGSGGGMGNLGEAAAGGGAIEIIAEGDLVVQSGVKIAMNGGSVFVNPSQGAYFSGGSGSGGAIRLVGRSIKNFGFLEAKGGNSSGGDPREIGARFLSNAGGAGGGGRVALISDNEIINGFINVNGGNGNGDGYGGFAGSIYWT